MPPRCERYTSAPGKTCPPQVTLPWGVSQCGREATTPTLRHRISSSETAPIFRWTVIIDIASLLEVQGAFLLQECKVAEDVLFDFVRFGF
jgi:hypothetical protein